MSASNFNELRLHEGHELECVVYGDNENVAVEGSKQTRREQDGA